MGKIPAELHEILNQLSPQQRRLFACDCAEHVLPLFERFQPLDNRPRKAIEVARHYALGTTTLEALESASGDAEGAAWDAVEAGVWSDEDGNEFTELATDPESDAAAPAAATAEGCSIADLDRAVQAAVETAIEVVVTAAVGAWKANLVWSGASSQLDEATLQRYQDAEARERAWQLQQARHYISPQNQS